MVMVATSGLAAAASGCVSVGCWVPWRIEEQEEVRAFLSQVLQVAEMEDLRDRSRSAVFIPIHGYEPGKQAWIYAFITLRAATFAPGPVATVWSKQKPARCVSVLERLDHAQGICVVIDGDDNRIAWSLKPGEVLRVDGDLNRVTTGGCLSIGALRDTVVCAYSPPPEVLIECLTTGSSWHTVQPGSVAAFPLRVRVWPAGQHQWEAAMRRAWRGLLRRACLQRGSEISRGARAEG